MGLSPFLSPFSAITTGLAQGYQNAQQQQAARAAAQQAFALKLAAEQNTAAYHQGEVQNGANRVDAYAASNAARAAYQQGVLDARRSEDVGTGKVGPPSSFGAYRPSPYDNPGAALPAPPPAAAPPRTGLAALDGGGQPSALQTLSPAMPPAPALPPLGQAPPDAGLGPAFLLKQKQATQASNSKANKDDANFFSAVGLMPPGQQGPYVSAYDARNGAAYPVPGAQVGAVSRPQAGPVLPGHSLPDIQTPVFQPPYSPNQTQAAAIDLKQTQAGVNRARVPLITSQAQLAAVRAQDQPALDGSQIVLRDAEGKALATNAGANAYRASVYGQVAPYTAQTGRMNADTAAGHLGLDTDKYTNPNTPLGRAGKPFDETTPQYTALAKEKTANTQRISQIQGMLAGKDANGNDITLNRQTGGGLRTELGGLQQRNAQIDRVLSGGPRLGSAGPSLPNTGGLQTFFTTRNGQACNGTQCGEMVSEALKANGIGTTATHLRNAAQADPALRVSPDASGNYPAGTVLYFRPTNGIVDGPGTNQHYAVVLPGGRVGESTSAGGGGGRTVRTDRTVAQLAAQHGPPLAINPRAASAVAPPHHSALQPRTGGGHFNGPPLNIHTASTKELTRRLMNKVK